MIVFKIFIMFQLKSESNRFLRAVACQCLKELETIFPVSIFMTVISVMLLTFVCIFRTVCLHF